MTTPPGHEPLRETSDGRGLGLPKLPLRQPGTQLEVLRVPDGAGTCAATERRIGSFLSPVQVGLASRGAVLPRVLDGDGRERDRRHIPPSGNSGSTPAPGWPGGRGTGPPRTHCGSDRGPGESRIGDHGRGGRPADGGDGVSQAQPNRDSRSSSVTFRGDRSRVSQGVQRAARHAPHLRARGSGTGN